MEVLYRKMNSFDEMSLSERKEYFENMRIQCQALKNMQCSFGQDFIKTVYPFFRNYKLVFEGVENVPVDSNVLFVANHSTSHDIFTAYEMFSSLNRRGSVMVATDCLSPITTQIFNISNATLLDRRIVQERHESVYSLSNKILNGVDGLIFGEGTWNLHPFKSMHNIHNGAAKISLITQVPIVPTIMEYIEIDEMVSADRELFDKCVIRFGKPIVVDYTDSLSLQSKRVKAEMTSMREQLWKDYGVFRTSLDDVDPSMYVNHTYAKKFEAFGFTYNSLAEAQFLLFLNGEDSSNEFTIDDDGNFVPGITEKSRKLKKVLK